MTPSFPHTQGGNTRQRHAASPAVWIETCKGESRSPRRNEANGQSSHGCLPACTSSKEGIIEVTIDRHNENQPITPSFLPWVFSSTLSIILRKININSKNTVTSTTTMTMTNLVDAVHNRTTTTSSHDQAEMALKVTNGQPLCDSLQASEELNVIDKLRTHEGHSYR